MANHPIGVHVGAADEGPLAAAAELEGHAEEFRADLAANAELVRDARTKAALEEIAPALETYVTQAQQIARATDGGNTAAGERLLPAFQTAFGELEGGMEEISTLIDASAEATEQQTASTARSTRQVLLAGMLVAVAVLAGCSELESSSPPHPAAPSAAHSAKVKRTRRTCCLLS